MSQRHVANQVGEVINWPWPHGPINSNVHIAFLAKRDYRYVWLMAWQIRLSDVYLSSVVFDVRAPYSGG